MSKIKTFAKKTYDLNKQQIMIVKKYIDEMLKKKFIKKKHFALRYIDVYNKKIKKKF